mmetsp:Transcript_80204/g.166938  ORF Transcript_80204/g.166938 Transcript_80204/m.166938 type:complete len:88 (+) Transcript_80204:508-771(+)
MKGVCNNSTTATSRRAKKVCNIIINCFANEGTLQQQQPREGVLVALRSTSSSSIINSSSINSSSSNSFPQSFPAASGSGAAIPLLLR